MPTVPSPVRPMRPWFGIDGGRTDSLLTGLSDRELTIIERSSTILGFPPGTVLIRQGDRGREFFIVLEGRLAVWRHGRVVARLGPGDHCGELSLLAQGPRNATVVAETGISVRVFEMREFATVINAIPQLVRRMLIGTAHRLREADIKAARTA